MKNPIIILLILISASAFAQDRQKFLYAEFADKSVSIYPSLKVFGNSFDLSFTFGFGVDYRQKGNFKLFQTYQLTGYQTLFVGSGVTLTSSFGCRYGNTSGFFGEAMAGLGTTAFFPSRETFAQNDNGDYVSVNPLIIRAALPFDLLLGYRVNKLAFYLQYRYMIIGPYTDILFVPVLGVTQTGIGVRYSL